MAAGKPTVLIADDNQDNIVILSEALGKELNILVATSGRQALDIAFSEVPDLILLDILMPDIDGYEVCRQLKSEPATRDIPVIFVTALGQESHQAKGLDAGAIDYITKPFSFSIVKARVRNHLEMKHYRDSLETLSMTDSLTGIPNRRHFDLVFSREWRRAIRNRSALSVILMDIDFFKAFNDHYGHLAGDECLRRVAAVLADNAKRPGDLAARFGGEEFICLLPETDLEGAAMAASRIREKIGDLMIPHAVSQATDHVTLSFGLAATIPSQEESPSDLIKQADRCLYAAKRSGRDRIVFDTISPENREPEPPPEC